MIIGRNTFKDVDVEPIWRMHADEEHRAFPPEWTARVATTGACPGTAEQQASSCSSVVQTGGTCASAACWKKSGQVCRRKQAKKGEEEDGGKKETEHCCREQVNTQAH